MGTIINIDAGIRQVVQEALDDLYANQSEGGLGTSCRLVYPPRFVVCTNCIIDPIGGKSSNRPAHGAPVPFQAGQSCPVCSGEGRKASESYDDITFKLAWVPKNFFSPDQNLRMRAPNSVVETKGFMKDVPKVMKAAYLIINLPIEPYIRQRFVLLKAPGDSSTIVPGRFFVSYWSQVDG